jgi:hypothetical protein
MQPGRFLSAAFWLLITLAMAGTAMAQNPFSGTWKLNQEKSQLSGDTMKFSPAEGQGMELTAGGTSYSFRVDGNNYAMPSGNLAIWRQSGADGWTTEYRTKDGKLLASDSWKLSADGKNLSVTTSGVRANGDLYTDTATYERTAGTSGLTGGWKSTTVKMSSPAELIMQESGLDGLVIKIPEMKITCEANFDGREVAAQGPDVPTGFRLGLTRTGPYSFRMVQKLNGNTIDSSVYTVSQDGKTMTQVGGAPGDTTATVIWEKQ